MAVHVVFLRHIWPSKALHIANESNQHALNVFEITDEYRRLASPIACHAAGAIDVRHLVVRAFKYSQSSDVALCTIGEMRHHTKLLRPSRMLQYTTGSGRHRELHASRFIGLHLTAFANPVAQQIVILIALAKPSTAFVRHRHCGLGQEQACGGLQRICAPPQFLAGERVLVERGIECPQRQSKATLAVWRAMTRAAATAEL